MITKGDDLPLHQTPEPVAYSGTDRNFYDRYFFNGYNRSGKVFFALAFGVYPHLNVKDAAFCVIADGVQHNLRASAMLNMERLDMTVGPIEVKIIEPLSVLRIIVDAPEHGIYADLTFAKRCPVVEEPRFTHRVGPRTLVDYTRMTQNGAWQGSMEIAGKRIEVTGSDFIGTRDRSWGIRSIGLRDPQPAIPTPTPQFYWLWAPVNFERFAILYGENQYRDGSLWHRNIKVIPCAEEEAMETFTNASMALNYVAGTRHLKNTQIRFSREDGASMDLFLTPRYHFYMSGLGYLHPQWGHGVYHGPLDTAYDTIDLATADGADILHRHIQAVVDARLVKDGEEYRGLGVLEQLVIGPHNPSGFANNEDMAGEGRSA